MIINCVHSIVPIGSAHDTDVADWDKCFDVNAKGMFFVCKYLIQKVGNCIMMHKSCKHHCSVVH